MTLHQRKPSQKISEEFVEMVPVSGSKKDSEKKGAVVEAIEYVDTDASSSQIEDGKSKPAIPPETARDIVTEILAVEDDPTLVSDLYLYPKPFMLTCTLRIRGHFACGSLALASPFSHRKYFGKLLSAYRIVLVNSFQDHHHHLDI